MVASVSNTVIGIIKDAMQDAGLLEEGCDPNSEQLSANMRRLNDIINLWQTQGIKLFLLQEVNVPLIAGQATYTFYLGGGISVAKPLRALQGYVLAATGGTRRPLNLMSWDEWVRIGNSTMTGTINSFFVNKQASQLAVTFWLIPDATEALNTVKLLMQTQVTNPINLEEDMAFPQEWRIALRWGLADDICTGQPQAIMDRCASRAQTYRNVLEDWDVEDASTSFQVDSQALTSSRFN